MSRSGKIYLLVTLLVVVLTPTLVIVISYSMLLIKVHQNTLRCRAVGARRDSSRSDFQLTAISVAVCVGFIVAWMPYAAVSTYYGLLGGRNPPPYVAIAPVLLAKSSCAYNPVFYVFITMRYRQEMAKVLPRFLARLLQKDSLQNRTPLNDDSRHMCQTTAPMTSKVIVRADDDSEVPELALGSIQKNASPERVVAYKFTTQSNGKAVREVHYVQTHCQKEPNLFTSVGIQCKEEHLNELPNSIETCAHTPKDILDATETCILTQKQKRNKNYAAQETSSFNEDVKEKVIAISPLLKNEEGSNKCVSTMPRPSSAKRHSGEPALVHGTKYSAIIKRRSSVNGLRRCRSWDPGDGDIFVLSNLNLVSERKLNPKEVSGEPLKLVGLKGSKARKRGNGAKLVTLILAQHQDDVFTELIV
ncbi:G protein-coupled receptor rhodopsin-like [Trinorchestia longiramus]|nr:G protein-coupled receptor rhodopsin-like [Trinorchestia longiramus]